MRSRSSRLFVVLLHLVGVSTNLPRNPFLAAFHPDNLRSGVGIVGVHPLSILLEPLELQAAGGLNELLSLLEGAGYDVDKTILGEPYWLQDDTDGTCLGPDGFSECGDATLWKIRRRPTRLNSSRRTKQHQQRRETTNMKGYYKSPGRQLLAIFGIDGPSSDEVQDEKHFEDITIWQYALELIDVNTFLRTNRDTKSISPVTTRTIGTDYQEGECIISLQTSDVHDRESGSLEMGSCSSDDAWSWSINEGGILKWEDISTKQKQELNKQRYNSKVKGKILLGGPFARFLQASSSYSGEFEAPYSDQDDQKEEEQIRNACLFRFNNTSAATASCDLSSTNEGTEAPSQRRLVSFSVIQYQNSAAVSPKLPRFNAESAKFDISPSPENPVNRTTEATQIEEEDNHSHLPHTKSYSNSRSSSPEPHKHVKVPTGVGGYSTSGVNLGNHPRNSKPKEKRPHISDGRPHALLGVGGYVVGGYVVGGYVESFNSQGRKKGEKVNLLHHPPSPSAGGGGAATISYRGTPHKPRKIPVHPYIAASQNGMYADPQSGLTFPTDIHSYLGHERKLSGRHTLMGVGLFTKTMLKLKIYGIALYVPKRDVLADSNFAAFAHLNVDELRKNENFYNHLMAQGNFDRTLFIKLNMQLGTETVRQSLSAEWKLLSDKHKKLLADSSALERQAEETMLKKIQSEENSSNCSCGQFAPEEYNADPSCCARGTEMVFTWRKTGELELRIDGRIMDIFDDPLVGKGIFYEYLRRDDPMSADARNHFADGFPFLLAPLAQVKGVSSSIPTSQDKFAESGKLRRERFTLFNRMIKIAEELNSSLTTRADDASKWVQGNLNSGVEHLSNGFRTVSKRSHNLASEIEVRREQIMSHLSREKIKSQLSPEQLLSNLSTMQEHALHHISSFQSETAQYFMNRLPFLRRQSDTKATTIKETQNSDLKSKSSKRKRDFRHRLAKMLDESSTKRPFSDEIGVIIEPTMSSTRMLFLYMVHFYLVLLLIVSVPDLHTTRLVIKRSSMSTVDSESDNEERLTQLEGMSSDLSSWDQLPPKTEDFVPRLVAETSVHEDVVELSPQSKRHSTQSMKKSLSYYL